KALATAEAGRRRMDLGLSSRPSAILDQIRLNPAKSGLKNRKNSSASTVIPPAITFGLWPFAVGLVPLPSPQFPPVRSPTRVYWCLSVVQSLRKNKNYQTNPFAKSPICLQTNTIVHQPH